MLFLINCSDLLKENNKISHRHKSFNCYQSGHLSSWNTKLKKLQEPSQNSTPNVKADHSILVMRLTKKIIKLGLTFFPTSYSHRFKTFLQSARISKYIELVWCRQYVPKITQTQIQSILMTVYQTYATLYVIWRTIWNTDYSSHQHEFSKCISLFHRSLHI